MKRHHLTPGQVRRICAKWKHATGQRTRNFHQGNRRRKFKWQTEVNKWGALFVRCVHEAEERQIRAAQQRLANA